MRKAITYVKEPYLSLYTDHDYLTVGEVGNILIRFQTALRSLADLSHGRREQPRFIISSTKTTHSLEIVVRLSILVVVAQIPYNLNYYQKVASKAFQRFKMMAMAIAEDSGFKITATRREVDSKLPRQFLEEPTPRQRKKLTDFIGALTRPANSVVIKDANSETTLERPDPPKLL